MARGYFIHNTTKMAHNETQYKSFTNHEYENISAFKIAMQIYHWIMTIEAKDHFNCVVKMKHAWAAVLIVLIITIMKMKQTLTLNECFGDAITIKKPWFIINVNTRLRSISSFNVPHVENLQLQ